MRTSGVALLRLIIVISSFVRGCLPFNFVVHVARTYVFVTVDLSLQNLGVLVNNTSHERNGGSTHYSILNIHSDTQKRENACDFRRSLLATFRALLEVASEPGLA